MIRQFRRGIAFAALAMGSPGLAQQRTIDLGPITSIQSCTYFQNREGAAVAYLSPWFAAFASSWRSWWVKDCVDRFPTFRDSITAALVATNKFSVGRGGLQISIALSNLSEGGPAPRTGPIPGDGYSVSQAWASVGVDVTVRDRSGQVILGAPFIKKVETGFDIRAGGEHVWGQGADASTMAQMQREVALAVARFIAFKTEPLMVTQVNGSDVELNYGSPVLKIGDMVSVEGGDGLRGLRYRIVSVGASSAVAEIDGDNRATGVRTGNHVNFIEQDSDDADARRYRRVPLP